MPQKTGYGTRTWPGCRTVALKTPEVAPATMARFFPDALKTMKSPPASESSGRRASNRPRARFSYQTHTDFNFHGWAPLKPTLKPGTVKIQRLKKSV
jgi:hypothetical protein